MATTLLTSSDDDSVGVDTTRDVGLTETALLGPFWAVTGISSSLSDSESPVYASCIMDGGGGSGGRSSTVVSTLAVVARPALFRVRLSVLNFTVVSTGAPLMAVAFRRPVALGIEEDVQQGDERER